ncbi:HEXXH motif-containing putative peptide modification protein [Rhizobium sp. BK491]|uniref:HEXXH motif-containing putative peptide modification protein n=1 Tax=Rhizobium sp. BK491 TaxID=2587009 RepID=UPI00161910CC|nr:HEXXH motif-containing putative peptide modification protein [Rhizobium sp. BK491]MBB3571590.1 hypothetical protein [Rhizobium sp. BK491]
MSQTEKMLGLAVGRLPNYSVTTEVALAFDISPALEGLGAREVDVNLHAAAISQINDALRWCSARFPLGRPESDQAMVTSIEVGFAFKAAEIVSASSPTNLGHILLAAQWPLKSTYRLSSVLAHEVVHQHLYLRQEVDDPVRGRSLGYSPWKNCTRPGWLVWHSFWTFSCQVMLLAESFLMDERVGLEDNEIPSFLAKMMGGVGLNLRSLEMFQIVSNPELDRCIEAGQLICQCSESIANRHPTFSDLLDSEREEALRKFQRWADTVEQRVQG